MKPVTLDIIHGTPCRCRVLDGAIYVGQPCRRIGHRVTKRRVAQLSLLTPPRKSTP